MIFSQFERRAPPAVSIHVRNGIIALSAIGQSPKIPILSIPERCRAPCKSATHRFQHDQVAALDSAVLDRGIKRQRNRRGRSIGMPVDGDHHLFRRKAQFLRRSVEDARIRLVRDHPVDIRGGQARIGEDFVQHAGEVDDGVPEHFPTLHSQLADGAGRRGTAVDEQQIVVAAVGVELGRENAAFALLGAEHERAGAVAEQHAGRAVFPVEDPAEGLGADHQRLVRIARAEHRIGDRQRVEEAGADGVHVEGDAVGDAERRLDLGRRRREGLVGSRRGEDDEVDVGCGDAGMVERAARRIGGEAAGRLAIAGDIAVADAGALDDPLVGGVDALREFFVGDRRAGQRAADAERRPSALMPHSRWRRRGRGNCRGPRRSSG